MELCNMEYNISAKTSLDAIDVCNKISSDMEKYGVSKISNSGRIIIVEFIDEEVSDKSLKMINKLVR